VLLGQRLDVKLANVPVDGDTPKEAVTVVRAVVGK